MFLVLIKISITQLLLDNVKDEKSKWMKPGGGDGASSLIIICNNNAHGTWDSITVAKNEFLSLEAKKFGHNIYGTKNIVIRNKEISFGREPNPDAVFQIFEINESCPVNNFKNPLARCTADTANDLHVIKN